MFMNLSSKLPIRKKAWAVFSVAVFGLAWLLWVPVQSKPLVHFWELWPMLFTEAAFQAEFWMWLVGSTVVFLAGAIFLGWVLQFVLGLLLGSLARKEA